MYTVHTSDLLFEWDENKNRTNKQKHGVSFEEAESVFADEQSIRYDDPDHSEDEARFLMLGMSRQLNVLVVCHCFRRADEVIRIVSARRANRREADTYWSSWS